MIETSSSRDRQGRIHDFVLHHGELRAEDIARIFDVSPATVRRDLAALERRGLIERVWGRARVRSPIRYLEDFKAVADKEAAAKRAIAAAASRHVRDGMLIGLSAAPPVPNSHAGSGASPLPWSPTPSM